MKMTIERKGHRAFGDLFCRALQLGMGVLSSFAAPLQGGEEGLFDMAAIMSEPVEAAVLASRTEEGITTEEIEFTSRVVDGRRERVKGLFVYPAGGKGLPAVFWCMGGMKPAAPRFPEMLARKGYACMVITLPLELRQSKARFNVDSPREANMALLARDQMRGITCLSQRAEVDPERIAVGGPSYGGFFSTLVAGVDPRVKAGLSFFSGGHYALGTNLPQFNQLRSLEEVGIWNETIDPAFRHTKRAIPFLWAVSFNDNWFQFPAVIKTYEEAIDPGKQLMIIPHSRHTFPEEIDRSILDFLDTALTKTRPPFNRPGRPVLQRDAEGRASLHFNWTGDNPVAKAELVVSYGEITPWYGWVHRAAFIFPATVEGQEVRAALPVPSNALPLIAWGNLTDSQGVLTSTPPLLLSQRDLAGLRPDPGLRLNCVIDGELGPEMMEYYAHNHHPIPGVPDTAEKRSGVQSLRMERATDGSGLPPFHMKQFFNVPGLAHELEVWMKAEKPGEVTLSLLPVRPKNWDLPAVALLVAQDARLKPLLPQWASEPEPIRFSAPLGTAWQKVALSVPVPTGPVEGYNLEITVSGEAACYWVDSLSMIPVWPRG